MNVEPSADLVAAVNEAEPEMLLDPQYVPLAAEAIDKFLHALGLDDLHTEIWGEIDAHEALGSDVTQEWAERSLLRLKGWLREHGIPQLAITYWSPLAGCLVEWTLSGCNSER